MFQQPRALLLELQESFALKSSHGPKEDCPGEDSYGRRHPFGYPGHVKTPKITARRSSQLD